MARVLAIGRPVQIEGHVVEDDEGIDPERLATLTPRLEGISVLCWLLGDTESEALHGDRLVALLEYLVDTPVRGVVYERSQRFPAGERAVTAAESKFRIRSVVIEPGGDTAVAVSQLLG